MPKYATFMRREMMQNEINNAERVLGKQVKFDSDGQIDNPQAAAERIQNAHGIEQSVLRQKSELAKVTPPDIQTDEQRNAINQREAVLREAMLHGNPKKGIPPMRSHQQMWDRRAGDADKHLAWEQYIKNHNLLPNGDVLRVETRNGEKSMLDEWKDIRRVALKEQEEYSRDLASVETFRPDKTQSIDFMDYASKSFTPFNRISHEEYMAMWPEHQLTPVEQKIAAAEATGEAKAPTPEQIYASPKPKRGRPRKSKD